MVTIPPIQNDTISYQVTNPFNNGTVVLDNENWNVRQIVYEFFNGIQNMNAPNQSRVNTIKWKESKSGEIQSRVKVKKKNDTEHEPNIENRKIGYNLTPIQLETFPKFSSKKIKNIFVERSYL